MLKNPTEEKLVLLKLYGMAKALRQQLSSKEYKSLDFKERFGMLVDAEVTEKENRSLRSRLKKARLRQQACMENIDYRSKRSLDKSFMLKLSQCKWINEHLNVLLTGPCGVGKSYIACALAHKACLMGYKALYLRASRMFEDIAIAHGDGSFNKYLNKIARIDVLVIDDWGLSALTDTQQRDMLEIMEDRHGLRSTIITSQLPVKHWHEVIANPTLADAVLDRLVHNAYNIDIKGENMRKKNKQKNAL